MNYLIKVHDNLQVMKGSLRHENPIFRFVSVLLDWLRIMLLAKRALSICQKMVEVLDFWRGLPKSKQPGWEKPGENKSYGFLLSQMNDLPVPLKLCFLEETKKKLNNFLVTFQTSSPMVPFIINSLEYLIRSFVRRFIFPDILKMANTTHKLSQVGMTNPNMLRRTYGEGFFIDHSLC